MDALPVDVSLYKTVVDYMFDDIIVDLMSILDEDFDSELGPPAFPRLQLFGIHLFAEIAEIDDISKIPFTCYINDIFKILTPGKVPSRNTLASFLDCEHEIIILSAFVYTLVKLNDYGFLPCGDDIYVDSTDALTNSSIDYLITEDEIEALKLLKKWNLIHDGSEEQIRKTKTKLKIKLHYYKNHMEYSKLIGLALKRPKLYNFNIVKKLDAFENVLESTEKSYVSINFPEAVKIPSKRGKWDIGFLLQTVMSSNSVILSAILTKKSNDAGSLHEVEAAVIRNVKLLIELEKDYGERRNYKELKKIVEESKCWTDAGYDEKNNNKFVLTSTINFITLTKKLAGQINNKLRKKNNIGKKKKKKNKTLKNEDDYSITECQRVVDGYLCPFERPIKLFEVVYRKNDKDNKNEDLPDVLKKYDFKHKCEDCTGCPYYMKYGESCSVANYVEKTTKYEYELTNQFASGKFDEGYSKRFPISEGINGYLKRKKAMFYLWGHNIRTATNHLLIKCIIYNLKRFVKLKGSVC